MAILGNLFSGSQSSGFQAQSGGPAQQANLANPVTDANAQAAMAQTQGALQQQQGAVGQQQALANALQSQNGIGNQSSVFNQLQGVANGTGPNPAQAMLAQQTGANTANQAALMAGQRGAGANAGLMARQAAQQGAANQQNAVSQGATMQANQSLNAMGQLGNIAGQQVNQQMAGTGAATQAAQNLTAANQNQQGQMLGQIGAQNQAALQQAGQTNQFNVQNAGQQNTANANIAAQNIGTQKEIGGGLLKGLSSVAGLANGGMVPHYAEGTPNQPIQQASPPPIAGPAAPSINSSGPKSAVGKFLVGSSQPSDSKSLPALTTGISDLFSAVGSRIKGSPNTLTDESQPQGIDTNNLAGSVAAPSELQHGLNDATNSPDINTTAPKGGNIFGVGTGEEKSFASGGPIGGALSGIGNALSPDKDDDKKSSGGFDPSMLAAAMARGGKVPAMVSPGEIYLKPGAAREVANGKKSPMDGEHIKGKASVKGDSLKNDTVPKTLDEGGVVIPRSVLDSKNPHAAAYKFVNAVISKSKKK